MPLAGEKGPEARIIMQTDVADESTEGVPLLVRANADSAPALLALTPVNALRRESGFPIARSSPNAPICRVFENYWTHEVDGGLVLRDLDVLSLTRHVAAVERGQHGDHSVEGIAAGIRMRPRCRTHRRFVGIPGDRVQPSHGLNAPAHSAIEISRTSHTHRGHLD